MIFLHPYFWSPRDLLSQAGGGTPDLWWVGDPPAPIGCCGGSAPATSAPFFLMGVTHREAHRIGCLVALVTRMMTTWRQDPAAYTEVCPPLPQPAGTYIGGGEGGGGWGRSAKWVWEWPCWWKMVAPPPRRIKPHGERQPTASMQPTHLSYRPKIPSSWPLRCSIA